MPLMYNTVIFGVVVVTNEEFDGLSLILKVFGNLFTSITHHKFASESKAVDNKGAACPNEGAFPELSWEVYRVPSHPVRD